MIRFTTRLVLRSMRWVAPFLVATIWVISVLGGGRSTGLELASVLFPAYLVAGTWLTIITGNIDDDAHRDLVAAALGSSSRLHLWRSATVLSMTSTVALVITVLVALVAQPGRSSLTVITVTTAVSTAGLLIGIGIGTLLHRPVLRHRGLSVLIATGACVMVMLLPQIQSVHRALDDDKIDTIWVLLVGAAVWAVASCACASRLAARRAR